MSPATNTNNTNTNITEAFLAEDDNPSLLSDRHHVWIWQEDDEARRKRDSDPGGTWRRPPAIEPSSLTGGGEDGVPSSTSSCEVVTTTVRNWCEGFVLSLDLCPWARASVQTPGAMRFFLVPPPPSPPDPVGWGTTTTTTAASAANGNNHDGYDDDEATVAATPEEELPFLPDEEHERQRMNSIIETVAQRFETEILNHPSSNGFDEPQDDDNDEDDASLPESSSSPSSVLERAAIYFVVFLSHDETRIPDAPPQPSPPLLLSESFPDFLDWFTELEEDWPEELDDVIIAPFHPRWEFGGGGGGGGTEDDEYDDEACLDYEKRSPYPLVTLVSTGVVENAGTAVTEAIGDHNRDVLLGIEARSRRASGEDRDDVDEDDDHHHQSTATDKTSSSSSSSSIIPATEDNQHHGYRNKSVGELWRAAIYGRDDSNRKNHGDN